MISYIDVDLLEAINAAESGQGIRDRGGLEGAVQRPWDTYGGEDLYVTAEEKAAALFHSLASAQYFVDGNKRTAWIASQFLYEALGNQIKPLPVSAKEVFALTVATVKEYDAEPASGWFDDHKLRDSDKVDYGFLSLQAAIDQPHTGVWSGYAVSVAGVGLNASPASLDADIVFRMLWGEIDVNRTPTFKISVSGERGKLRGGKVGIQADEDEEFRFGSVVWTGHAHHPDGVMPYIYKLSAHLELLDASHNWITVSCDGKYLFSRPLTVSVLPNVPEDASSL